MLDNGIAHVKPSPYSPASNGQAERRVRVMKELLKKQCQSESLKCRLSKALLYYRCTPHSVKKIAPSVFLNKRKYVTSRNRINPNYHHASGPRPTSSSKIPQFELGDTVHALNVREGKKKWFKGTVTQRNPILVANNIFCKFACKSISNEVRKGKESRILDTCYCNEPQIQTKAACQYICMAEYNTN